MSQVNLLPLDECYYRMYACIDFEYFIESGQLRTFDAVKMAFQRYAAAFQHDVDTKRCQQENFQDENGRMNEYLDFLRLIESGQLQTFDDVRTTLNQRATAYQEEINVKKALSS